MDWALKKCIRVYHRWPCVIIHTDPQRGATQGLALGRAKEEDRCAPTEHRSRLWMITWFPGGLQSALLD